MRASHLNYYSVVNKPSYCKKNVPDFLDCGTWICLDAIAQDLTSLVHFMYNVNIN